MVLIGSAAAVSELELQIVRDDGVVVYINGSEVFRDNMPTGSIDSETLASTGITGDAEDQWLVVALPPTSLVDGSNVIAVEIHQKHRSSSDTSFDLMATVNP